MRNNRIVIRLAVPILALALLAAGMGVFGQGEGQPRPFTTLRGETALITGHGLYRYDAVSSATQEVAQDVVTLVIGIPLLAAGIILSRKNSLRGHLLLTGGLAYFLYTYGAMSFLTAFNPLFLAYVALFSLSLFGFILALAGLDREQVMRRMSARFPRWPITVFMIVVAAFLALAWLGLVIPPALAGTQPAGLDSATTMVIQVLDLGVIVPTAVLTASLLWRQNPWGYTLASVVLVKMLTMGAALIAMVIGQLLAGVAVDMVVSAIFVVISLAGIVLGIAMLRSVEADTLKADTC
jgi:hypothetical protein